LSEGMGCTLTQNQLYPYGLQILGAIYIDCRLRMKRLRPLVLHPGSAPFDLGG